MPEAGAASTAPPPDWLPPDKTAAICLTIDDVHPGTSKDAYEAGGDLGRGQLRHVEWLLERHPQLKVTLFTTADWRATFPEPRRKLLARIPALRDLFYLADVLPEGTMRLDRHPAFVDYLKRLPRTDIALHGLTHARRGLPIPVEFLTASYRECCDKLDTIIEIFRRADLPFSSGMTPPGWHLSPALAKAMIATGLTFVGSARDLLTPIAPNAVTRMSGLHGVSLIYPQWVFEGLLHFTTNFQATSSFERADAIIANGGLLSIKAHVVKKAGRHVALDGLDEGYCRRLDALFQRLKALGDKLWWTSMGEIASRVTTLRSQAAQ